MLQAAPMSPPSTISRALRSLMLAVVLWLAAAGSAAAAACSGRDPSAAACEIGAERGARDLPPLQVDDRLALAARRHARGHGARRLLLA